MSGSTDVMTPRSNQESTAVSHAVPPSASFGGPSAGAFLTRTSVDKVIGLGAVGCDPFVLYTATSTRPKGDQAVTHNKAARKPLQDSGMRHSQPSGSSDTGTPRGNMSQCRRAWSVSSVAAEGRGLGLTAVPETGGQPRNLRMIFSGFIPPVKKRDLSRHETTVDMVG